MATDRPLLVLPPPAQGPPPTPPPKIGGGAPNPKKGRQVERLGPQFEALRIALERKRLALQNSPSGAPLEQVLVFETNGAVQSFLDAMHGTPGFAWLADAVEDRDQDIDFSIAEKPEKSLSARLYMVLTNQNAIEQLLTMWNAYKTGLRGDKAPAALKLWRPIFRCLREVRRWGVQDRIGETGIREDWNAAIAMGASAVPVELELWSRSNPTERPAAEARVVALVAAAGGTVLDRASIPEIAYHAVLAELPRAEASRIIENSQDVDLAVADDVRLFRPTPQMVRPYGATESEDGPGDVTIGGTLREPTVALLDGLPIENHAYLAGRLIVDDPDEFGATYQLPERRHGTAMASLILHGDLSSAGPPLPRRLYVRPILLPRDQHDRSEMAPRARLWVDLIYRAVLRMVEGVDGQRPAAPSVRIVNLSIGDTYQPFLHSISPLARLLDWLAWRYRLLFVVSAGNHLGPIQVDGVESGFPPEIAVVKGMHSDHRNRRILAPAEAVNALTVGSAHEDEAGSYDSPSPDQGMLFRSVGLPSPTSALGRGVRNAVKPDVLAPGGRAIYTRQPGPSSRIARFDLALGPKLPGQKVAAPGSMPGMLSALRFGQGTSNAAALTTRAAAQILDSVTDLRAGSTDAILDRLPLALVTKALVVHTAAWSETALSVIRAAIKTPQNASLIRDLSAAFLGYGQVRPDRVVSCTEQRATLIGGGFIRPSEQWNHAIPLPPILHAQTCWRRLLVTLAWFTPIHPTRREYRSIELRVEVPRENVLRAVGVDVDARAVVRGTVQHEVLYAGSGAMDIGRNDMLRLPVTCFEGAPLVQPLPAEGVPYALAVTIEVAPETGLPIYEQVRSRVRPGVRIES